MSEWPMHRIEFLEEMRNYLIGRNIEGIILKCIEK
jgi:hypothetical protein